MAAKEGQGKEDVRPGTGSHINKFGNYAVEGFSSGFGKWGSLG